MERQPAVTQADKIRQEAIEQAWETFHKEVGQADSRRLHAIRQAWDNYDKTVGLGRVEEVH